MLKWFKKKSEIQEGPDFSSIDSSQKVQELFSRGELEKLLLLPVEFGGEEIPQNTVYVPLGIAEIKLGMDNNIIGPLVSQGNITRYKATPEYQGRSFVPIAIHIHASDPGNFKSTVEIWGDALKRK